MNDLVYVIKRSNLSAYADDTQIFFGDKDPLIVQESRNSDLSYVDKWFLEKGMKRNHCEYQPILSFDLIGQHQNGRFHVTESFCRSGSQTRRERSDDWKCVCCSQATDSVDC